MRVRRWLGRRLTSSSNCIIWSILSFTAWNMFLRSRQIVSRPTQRSRRDPSLIEISRSNKRTMIKDSLFFGCKVHLPIAHKKGSTSPGMWCLGRYKDMSTLETNMDQGVSTGGVWTSSNQDLVGILLPYRDREQNLLDFLSYIIPFMKTTGQNFHIFLIHQAGSVAFNRASLLNVGFLEAKKINPNITCFAFHDVDKIPLQYVQYACADQPRSIFRSSYNVSRKTGRLRLLIKKLYQGFVGGILLLKDKVIWKINGCTNLMYGWGGEDDNLYQRFVDANLTVLYPKDGKYFNLPHTVDSSNTHVGRSAEFSQYLSKFYAHDGLNSLRYTLHGLTFEKLYTNISVSFPGPSKNRDIQTYLAGNVRSLIQNIRDSDERNRTQSDIEEFLENNKWKMTPAPKHSRRLRRLPQNRTKYGHQRREPDD